MPLTQDLGRFVAELSFERLPAEAVEVARTGFADCIATMIAGAQDPAPQLLRRALAPAGGEATLYFSGERAPAPEAAWINGTAGHALDYDDVASLRGHPSTVMVPAILAEGEALDASGRDMLEAYVAGYETWAELAARDPGHHHRKGWHPTGIFGPIGAAAACALLRRLDAQRTAHALALAASHSSGVMANFGTMTKPFHAGRAAHSGVISARLAEIGFTASPDALEHGQGFLSAVSPEGKADRESPADGLGRDWKIVAYRIGIKKYPACYCTHRALDAMLDLHRAASAEARGNRAGHGVAERHPLADPAQPPAADRARSQVQHGVRDGERGGRGPRRPCRIHRRICRAPGNPAADAAGLGRNQPELRSGVSGASVWDQVRVDLVAGGSVASEQVRRATGHADRPLSEAELFDKFRLCLDAGGSRIAPEILFERLRRLESGSARGLTAL